MLKALSGIKDEDFPKLVFTTKSKANDLEAWLQRLTMKIDGIHSLVTNYWEHVKILAEKAYAQYLILSPTKPKEERPKANKHEQAS